MAHRYTPGSFLTYSGSFTRTRPPHSFSATKANGPNHSTERSVISHPQHKKNAYRDYCPEDRPWQELGEAGPNPSEAERWASSAAAGRGAIADLTWPEIAGLDASYAARFGSTFAGRADCTVPRLTDFLDELRGHPVYLVLHLKALAGPDLDALLETITRRHMTPQCHFFGPPAAIDRIKLLEPGCMTLNDGMPGPAQYRAVLDHALARGHDAVSVSHNCQPDELLAMVDAIHSAGKLAHASYLAGDYARRTQELIDAGVDYILGNDPAELVEVFRDNGLRQVTPGE